MVGAIDSNGIVSFALFVILSITDFIINYLLKRKENNMNIEKKTIFKVVKNLFISILSTLWAIGASVTATADLQYNNPSLRK